MSTDEVDSEVYESLESLKIDDDAIDGDSTETEKQPLTEERPEKSKKDALIIFDWDDTLFPTSFMVALPGSPRRLSRLHLMPLSYEIYQDLKKAESSAILLLKRADTLGKVVIITNAQRDWVHYCATHFMPNLKAFLVGAEKPISIISARDLYHDHFPRFFVWWKQFTFTDALSVYIMGKKPTAENFSFMSVGDGPEEAMASVMLANHIPRKCIKLFILACHTEMNAFVLQSSVIYDQMEEALSETKRFTALLSENIVFNKILSQENLDR